MEGQGTIGRAAINPVRHQDQMVAVDRAMGSQGNPSPAPYLPEDVDDRRRVKPDSDADGE